MTAALAKNPFTQTKQRAQYFSDLWFNQGNTVNEGFFDRQDRIAHAYIAYVLNLGEAVAQRFATGNSAAARQVGLRQGNVTAYEPNLPAFWQEVADAFPGTYTTEDLEYLSTQGTIDATQLFLFQLGQHWESGVLRALSVNAHAYK